MNLKESAIFERCKGEISESQFLALVRLKRHMKEKGWKYERVTNPHKKNVVIERKDPSGHWHWIQVDSDGETIGLPVEMGCIG